MEQTKKYIGYVRTSVQKKRDGVRISKEEDYSLESQTTIIKNYIKKNGGELIEVFSEIESGRKDDRPMVKRALEMCKRENATLIVSRFSRFLRSMTFLYKINEYRVDFLACDFPSANPMMIGILASVYSYQASEIGKQVKESLAIAKEKRGGKDWRVCNFTPNGRIKAGKTKREKHLTPDILRITDYAKSLKESGLTWLEVSIRVRQSSFNEVLPFATPEKLMRLVKRA